ncbi:MAG: DUF1028 domain-containing protein [Anaerolineales bacterium]|nr:DUF1028 domain-containing protein [Anaerolineales bacterium]
MTKYATFSIVAYDPQDSAWGIAVASKFPAVGAVVPWAAADMGAVATQSYANTTFGPRGLELMAAGRSAEETLAILLEDDDERELRQVGLVDAQGNAATYTGSDCFAWAGGRTGEKYALQGNILTGVETIDAMEASFLETDGDLPARLLASLLAGDRAGGDRRGRQSAAIFIVKPQGGYSGFNDRWIDYRVDDHPDPVPKLLDLVELHRLYFGKSPEEEELLIEGEVAQTLQEIMVRLGFYSGPISGTCDEQTRESLRGFIGNENFEDRTNFEVGRIDRPVFEYLVRKFEK